MMMMMINMCVQLRLVGFLQPSIKNVVMEFAALLTAMKVHAVHPDTRSAVSCCVL